MLGMITPKSEKGDPVESGKSMSLDVHEPRSALRRTALVVGPDQELAIQVATMLPTWEVERTPSNCEALVTLKARQFDLVVTGENTSGADDLELLRQMRKVRAHTRLLIVTSESTPEDVIASMR